MKKVMIPVMVVLALTIVFAFRSVSNAGNQSFQEGEPEPELFSYQPMPINPIIDIPDANLRAAFHDATGVPDNEDIHKNDLKALTGTLTLSYKNIANAKGIEYCSNVSNLDLSNNNLNSLPDFSNMTNLKTLSLSKNKFISFPVGLAGAPALARLTINNNPLTMVESDIGDIHALQVLSMRSCDLTYFPPGLLEFDLLDLDLSHTPIGSLPDNIGNLENLVNLGLNDTGLSKLPDSLYTLDELESLALADNSLTSISNAISGMTSLNELGLAGNKLESLPDSLMDIHNLQYLYVNDNRLYSLPDDIGESNLAAVMAGFNRISSLPASIGESTHLKVLDIPMNRLTSLPSNLDDRAFEYIDVEFNFIDMSSGSAARSIMGGVSADEKRYLRQLEPVSGITATPGTDSIQLSWEPCSGGSDGDEAWEVAGYVIYDRSSGEMVELMDLEADVTQATLDGLTPETEYDLRVGVDYQITFEGDEMDDTLRGYTAIKVTTLTAVETPSESAEATAVAAASASTTAASPTSAAASDEITAAASNENGTSGLPVWAAIAIAVLGTGVLGTGAALLLKILKTRKAGTPHD